MNTRTAGYAVSASETHLPKWSLQMLNVRFTNALQAEFLDQS